MSLKSTLPPDIYNRIEEIQSMIFEIANGNYNFRLQRSAENNELDGLIGGINMLGEEIKASTVSRNYLQNIYRGVIDLLIILKKDFTIETANHQVLSSLGYTKDQLVDQPFSKLLGPNYKDSLDRIEKDLKENNISVNLELNLLTSGNVAVTHAVSFSLLSGSDDLDTSILVTAKDVTAFKETEERLKRQNEALKEIAWIQSHKVRGPVASIKGLMMLIDWDQNSLEENRQVFQNMQQTIEQLDVIIHEIVNKTGNLFEDEDSPQ
jgi:two-component system, sensor histidine kinase